MKLDPFVLENWLNPAANSPKTEIYLGGSCVLPMTVEELFNVIDQNLDSFIEEFKKMNLGYGFFEGTPRLRSAISKLYHTVNPQDIILVHGGTGANWTAVATLVEPEDNVISIVPNYQQYISIPKSIGAEVRDVFLKPEKGWILDVNEVAALVDKNTKAIMFTNPNNPTGTVIKKDDLLKLVEIAKSVDAWILCDEMYRGLSEEEMPSMADLYDKAIVTASSSKIYSMAGTRCGWIVCKEPDMRLQLFNRRSYDSICGGVFDEWIFAVAMENVDKIFQRSRAIVNKNKPIIDKWIEENPYLHQYAKLTYGTTYLVHYDLDVPARDFCDNLLDQKGVLVCHGDCFNLPYTFRISLSHAERLEEGLNRINQYIEELVGKGHATK